MIIYLIYK